MNFLRRWWPALFLALLPLMPLWRAVFLGEGIGPWDHIGAMAPWNGPKPQTPWDILQADGVLQFAVWRDLVLDAWSRGEAPFWNPYQLMGTPLLGNSQSGGFYPPHILMGLFKVPTIPAITVLAWLHLFLAGLGVLFLVRKLGGNRVGGVVAGSAFALSPFMVSWTPLASVITTVAWIPWALGCVVALFGAESRAEHAKAVSGLAASVAMMLLGGHLQFSAYGLLSVVLLLAALAIGAALGTAGKPSLRSLLGTFLGLGIGGALAAPQVLPVLEYSQYSHRQNLASEEGYHAFAAGAIEWYQLAGLAYPTALGNPHQSHPVVPELSTYWPAFAKPGAHFAEAALGIGPLILIGLAMVSRRKWASPAVAGLSAVGLLALLIALGTPINRLMYFGLPGWSASGSPGRASVLFVIAACAIGGLGISRLCDERETSKATRTNGGFALLLGLLTLVFASVGAAGLQNPDIRVLASRALPASLLAIAALTAIAASTFTLPTRERWHRRALLLGAAVVAAPLLFNMAFPLSTGQVLPKSLGPLAAEQGSLDPTMQRIAVVNNNWELILPQPALLPPNMASWNRIAEVGGYDSLLHRSTKSLLDEINGRDSAPPTNGNMLFVKKTLDVEKLAEAGVTDIWSMSAIPGLESAFPTQRDAELFRYAVPGPGRVNVVGGSGEARVTFDGFSSTHVVAKGPGTLVLRDRNMPGWTATVDGKPAEIQGEAFRELGLPPGSHKIVFSYTPPGLYAGIFFALCGAFGLGALLLFGIRGNLR